MNIKEAKLKYVNDNIYIADYLFHGSNKKIKILEPRQARCATKTPVNLRNAVYATSVFDMAMCYAILRNIKTKKYYDDKTNTMVDDYAFKISGHKKDLKVVIERGAIPLDAKGYVYVFEHNNFIKEIYESVQYISKKSQQPIDVIEVEYKDVEKYITYKNEEEENLSF